MVATENKHIMSKIDTAKGTVWNMHASIRRNNCKKLVASGNSRIKAGSWFSLLLRCFSIAWFFKTCECIQWKIRIKYFKKQKQYKQKTLYIWRKNPISFWMFARSTSGRFTQAELQLFFSLFLFFTLTSNYLSNFSVLLTSNISVLPFQITLLKNNRTTRKKGLSINHDFQQ